MAQTGGEENVLKTELSPIAFHSCKRSASQVCPDWKYPKGSCCACRLHGTAIKETLTVMQCALKSSTRRRAERPGGRAAPRFSCLTCPPWRPCARALRTSSPGSSASTHWYRNNPLLRLFWTGYPLTLKIGPIFENIWHPLIPIRQDLIFLEFTLSVY